MSKMKFTLTPRNEFYDGWLAWILGVSEMQKHSEAFREGWKMADETGGDRTLRVGGSLLLLALVEEIDKGHIKLTMEDE